MPFTPRFLFTGLYVFLGTGLCVLIDWNLCAPRHRSMPSTGLRVLSGRDDPSETRVELFKLREFHMEGAHVYSEKGVAVGPHGALYVVSSPEEIRLTDKAHRSVEQICVDFSPCLASLKSAGAISHDVFPALDAIAVSPKGVLIHMCMCGILFLFITAPSTWCLRPRRFG